MSTLLLVLLDKTFSFNVGKLEIKLSTIKHSLLQPIGEIKNIKSSIFFHSNPKGFKSALILYENFHIAIFKFCPKNS
jgi:hypothetical protein